MDYHRYWEGSTFADDERDIDLFTKAMIRQGLIGGSVLDIGCGTGRLLKTFSRREHWGFDYSKDAVDTLKTRTAHPERFWEADLVTFDTSTRYDNVFSMVALQHIPSEFIKDVAAKISRWGKNIILIESRDDGKDWAEHCYKHDYQTLFNLEASMHLYGPVWIMKAKGEA
jgi:SAM-dependent methyltransferase